MVASSDFSWLALFLAGLATVAQAYTTPVGDPKGNPISKPSLNEQVPVGKPYTITWEPTTDKEGTVTIVLMRGPSENVQPLYPIVEKTKNDGSYTWTPKSDLEDDTTHYGLQLIVDATGQYQWSTQFGISNPGYSGSGKPSSISGDGSTSASMTSTRSVHLASSSSSSSSISSYSSSKAIPSYVASTGYPMGNSSIIHPTGTVTVPSSLKTTKKPHTSTTVLATTEAPASTTASSTTSAETLASTAGAAVVRAAGALAGVAAAAVFAF